MSYDKRDGKAHFRTYGGVGIRLGVDGSWAYNTDFGEAVKLTFQFKRKEM